MLEICEEMGRNVKVLFLGQNKENDTSWCFVFFYGMISQVQPQDKMEERLRKTKFIIPVSLRDRTHAVRGHMGTR